MCSIRFTSSKSNKAPRFYIGFTSWESYWPANSQNASVDFCQML